MLSQDERTLHGMLQSLKKEDYEENSDGYSEDYRDVENWDGREAGITEHYMKERSHDEDDEDFEDEDYDEYDEDLEDEEDYYDDEDLYDEEDLDDSEDEKDS